MLKQIPNKPSTAAIIVILTFLLFTCKAQTLAIDPDKAKERILVISYNSKNYTVRINVLGFEAKKFNLKK
jgi:hypothetical protein